MRTYVIGLFLAVSMAFAASAQSVLPPEQGIEDTIQSQVDAFLVDDFAEAFTFASPMIQGMFGSPERFGAMVRNGYPMVWRPSEVEFLELRNVNGFPVQRVLMRDAEGRVHFLDYQMIPGKDGWRINGVTLVRAPGVAA